MNYGCQKDKIADVTSKKNSKESQTVKLTCLPESSFKQA